MPTLDRIDEDDLRGPLEALLLVSSEAVPATELAQVLGVSLAEVEQALSDLSSEYADANRGIPLREVPGGWRLFTHPAHHEVVEAYVLSWESARLSQAALETLSVIAYHQPVSRDGVKAIRGVNSDGVITSLRAKGLIRELGRQNGRTGAILYGTTKTFLENFGLRSLKDLPPLEDFAPDEQSRQFIRERLSGSSISSTLEETSEEIEAERDLLDGYDELVPEQDENDLVDTDDGAIRTEERPDGEAH
jgi:segregation and condensation protein B